MPLQLDSMAASLTHSRLQCLWFQPGQSRRPLWLLISGGLQIEAVTADISTLPLRGHRKRSLLRPETRYQILSSTWHRRHPLNSLDDLQEVCCIGQGRVTASETPLRLVLSWSGFLLSRFFFFNTMFHLRFVTGCFKCHLTVSWVVAICSTLWCKHKHLAVAFGEGSFC